MLLKILSMSSDEIKLLSEAMNIDVTLKHAKEELKELQGDLKTKEAAVDNVDKGIIKNAEEWHKAKDWMVAALKNRQNINKLSQDIEALEKDLDTRLGAFRTLSGELTALLGLDQKEKNSIFLLSCKIKLGLTFEKKQRIRTLLVFFLLKSLLYSCQFLIFNRIRIG